MPFLELAGGIRLHYLDENPTGSAAIILLHGLGADASSWQLQIPALTASGWRVLAPDTPGFGQSSYKPGAVAFRRTAQLLAELLRRLEIPTCNVVGISMGGVQALQFTLDFPHLVQKLVLVNTFARLNLGDLRQLPYFLLRFLLVHTLGLRRQAEVVARRIFPQPDQADLREILIQQICQADPRAYRAAIRALGRFNVSARLDEIRCPTLVVTGSADTTVPPENQALLAAGIPGARHVILPGAGHAVTVEQPEAFNSLLVEFLSDAH